MSSVISYIMYFRLTNKQIRALMPRYGRINGDPETQKCHNCRRSIQSRSCSFARLDETSSMDPRRPMALVQYAETRQTSVMLKQDTIYALPLASPSLSSLTNSHDYSPSLSLCESNSAKSPPSSDTRHTRPRALLRTSCFRIERLLTCRLPN